MVAAGSQIDRKLLIGILETVDSWVSFCAEKNTVYPPWPGHRSNWVAGKGTTLIDLCLDSWWLTCWDDDNDIPIIPKKNPQETIASVMFFNRDETWWHHSGSIQWVEHMGDEMTESTALQDLDILELGGDVLPNWDVRFTCDVGGYFSWGFFGGFHQLEWINWIAV